MRKLKLLMMLCLVTIAVSADDDTYTVAGNEASIFGSAWDATISANDMTAGANGVYTKTYEAVEITESTTIEYKVVKNHSWDESWGFSGNNANYVINNAGTYDITFSFNPTTAFSDGNNVACAVAVHIDGATPATFNDGGKYLFKNVGSGRYLGPSNSWGTQASLLAQSHYNTIHQADGKFTIESQVSNGGTNYYFGGSFMDSGATNIDIVQLPNGNYVMSTTGTAFYGYDGTSTVLASLTDYTAENAQWQIVSYDDALADATEENPVDATYRILDQNFDRNNRHSNKENNDLGSAWTVESSNSNLSGGDDTNRVAESWRAAFTLSQTITVPNGIYKIRAQAAITEYTVTGENLPVVYATSSNEATVPFNICTNGNTGMNQFSTNFTNGEFFTDWSDKVLVTNGQITVGVKGTRTDSWCVWDNIQLMYYGVDLTALKQAYSEALATAQAYEGNLFDEDWATLNAVITANTLDLDAALTEDQLNTATANLEAANEVAAAAAVKYSTYTSANTLINGGENVNLTSLIQNPSFENNFTGWTNTGNMAIQGNESFGKDGSNYAEFYQPNGTKGVSQTIGYLPAGIFKMNVKVRARGVTSAKVFAGGIDQAVTIVDADNDYTVNFAIDDKTDVLIGFEAVGTGAGSSWIALDNFRLTYVGGLPDALTAVEGKMNAEVAAAQTAAIEAYLASKTVANYNAAEEAIAAAQASINAYLPLGDAITKIDAALTAATTATASDADYQTVKTAYNNGTIADADIQDNVKAAYDAVIPVIKSQTAESADFTLAIQNQSFEYGDLTGWTITTSSDTGARETSNATYAATGTEGRYLFNTWWKGSPLTQTVADLPNGQYTLTASVASDGATIYLIANGGHNEGTETAGTYPNKDVMQEATITFVVEDGTATIGVVGGADGDAGVHKDYVEEGYWWYKADNFRLVKNRNLTPVYAVVGSNKDDETDKAIFSGAWDAAATTDLMTLTDGVYTKTFADQKLDAQTIAYKVIKKNDVESTTATWYGDGENNMELTVGPVKGQYDLTFTFTEEGSVVTGVATKTAEAVTIGEKGWATTVTNSALDFSAAEVEAYTAEVKNNAVQLTKITTDVQAETGLVLKGTEGTYYIPVAESSATDKGSLMFSSTLTYTTWHDNGGENNKFYGLTVNTNNDAQFALISCSAENEVVIPAQKAFLLINSASTARELSIVFEDGTTTGISAVAAENGAETVYNLQGQRVSKAQKGLFIVNGKKVVRK